MHRTAPLPYHFRPARIRHEHPFPCGTQAGNGPLRAFIAAVALQLHPQCLQAVKGMAQQAEFGGGIDMAALKIPPQPGVADLQAAMGGANVKQSGTACKAPTDLIPNGKTNLFAQLRQCLRFLQPASGVGQ